MANRVVMGLLFFPRGGSAHVARQLATSLPAAGWEVTIVTGSVSLPGRPGDARDFYRGLDVRPVDFTAALQAPDPLLADPPFHPSYEDRPDAPDPVMAALDDERYEHQVAAWSRALEGAGAAEADVLHLHHLTPINGAARARRAGRAGGRAPARDGAADARGDRRARATTSGPSPRSGPRGCANGRTRARG